MGCRDFPYSRRSKAIKKAAVITTRGNPRQTSMNIIFHGSVIEHAHVYDYFGVFTRFTEGVVWRASVGDADVVCTTSGRLEDSSLGDHQIRVVIHQLISRNVADLVPDEHR